MDESEFITKIVLKTVTVQDFRKASTSYKGIKKILSSHKDTLSAFNIDVEIVSLNITLFYLASDTSAISMDIEGSPFESGYTVRGANE